MVTCGRYSECRDEPRTAKEPRMCPAGSDGRSQQQTGYDVMSQRIGGCTLARPAPTSYISASPREQKLPECANVHRIDLTESTMNEEKDQRERSDLRPIIRQRDLVFSDWQSSMTCRDCGSWLYRNRCRNLFAALLFQRLADGNRVQRARFPAPGADSASPFSHHDAPSFSLRPVLG